jgi:hypothetical protein
MIAGKDERNIGIISFGNLFKTNKYRSEIIPAQIDNDLFYYGSGVLKIEMLMDDLFVFFSRPQKGLCTNCFFDEVCFVSVM